jgi:hypothetical protein
VFEEKLHASIPRFPNSAVNITGLIEEILLRTEIEVAEKVFPFVGRQQALRWPK